ncbi:MAG TPA: hypothetical protein PKK06_01295 [Phycisphaerae bacterium]|nr:hypothetical protein [Phycisphaerae bacterium]HNU46667.1 hypothetical protein [Phycisphaerae bacterium]
MAQAAFSVNDLKSIDKGEVLILEVRRQRAHGCAIDQEFLTFPAELRRVFAEFAATFARAPETPEAACRNVRHHRLEEYFDRDN